MKNIIALVVFVSFFAFGQTYTVNPYMKYIDFGTITDEVEETGYVSFDEFASIDSISIIASATGELDVDTIDCYVGVKSGSYSRYSTTALTSIVSLNVAAAGVGHELITVSDATKLTGAVLRGGNALKVITRGADSGNDATDPNNFKVWFRVWGTLK